MEFFDIAAGSAGRSSLTEAIPYLKFFPKIFSRLPETKACPECFSTRPGLAIACPGTLGVA